MFASPTKCASPTINPWRRHCQRMFFASAIAATDKWHFFRPKRRKQAFIGSRNKRPSSAVLLPDAVARWRGRRALPQSPFGRHEVNIAENVYPPPSPSPAVVLLMYSDSVLYAVSLFGWYIVLLLSVHVSVGVYCTDSGLCGLFSPPQKTANTVPLHTYQRMFFASAIAATDKYLSDLFKLFRIMLI